MITPSSNGPATPAFEVANLTKLQKLAALLIILGPDSAAQILKSLGPQDLEAVSAEMARLPLIPQEARHEILREMSAVALTAGSSIRGGVNFTKSALERAVGTYQAHDILDRVGPPRVSSEAIERLGNMDPRHLFNLIRDEHVQTIALLASYLTPEKASALLALLRPDLRDQVIERLATLEPTPVEVLERIVEVLQRRISGKTGRTLNQTGGVRSAADVLNALNKKLSKEIIASLEGRNAELGAAIRQKMFTFTDLLFLDPAALQKVMREVDMRDLALALKRADDTLKARLLGGISKRAAEAVHEEMSFMTSVKTRDVEASQNRIIDIVRRLEADGEIELDFRQESAA
ncbi:MAG: hypothetical protein RJA22_2625 [Verrucomicrobiota bacterium]|jgi:flagellar motor switch protein FliG